LLQQWRANAGSATLSAYVGGWTEACDGDGVDNTVEEHSGIFSLIQIMSVATVKHS